MQILPLQHPSISRPNVKVPLGVEKQRYEYVAEKHPGEGGYCRDCGVSRMDSRSRVSNQNC